MTRMTWDENESQLHIMNHDDAPTSMGRPPDELDQASTNYGLEPPALTYNGPFGAIHLPVQTTAYNRWFG